VDSPIHLVDFYGKIGKCFFLIPYIYLLSNMQNLVPVFRVSISMELEVYLPWLGLTNRRNAPGTDSTWWTRTGVPREVSVVVEVEDVEILYKRWKWNDRS